MNYKEAYFKHKGLHKCDVIICEYCHTKVAVDIHHLLYRSHGGSDDPDNLIALCRYCHHSHHSNNNPTTEQLNESKHENRH